MKICANITLKKITISLVSQLSIEDKAWDEKLDEFKGDFDFVKEENEDGEEGW